MEDDSTPAMPVRPMDSRPITYPTKGLSSLSEDARVMYEHGRGPSLNRDVFDPKTRGRWVSPAQEKAFTPTDRMMAGIRELESAGLARYSDSHGHSLSLTRIHDHYTVAFGRGSQLIKVSTFAKYPEDSELLAVLVGGDLGNGQASSDRLPEWTVRCRHEDATDIEHDASRTAEIVINNPTMPVFSGYGRMRFHGVLTDARLYPLGADPLHQTDADTDGDGELCTLCETPHPFAPFLPPPARWLKAPTFVVVDAYPLRPYLVAAPPAAS